MTDPEKPTPESIAAAKPQVPLPEPPVEAPAPVIRPPVQRDTDWVVANSENPKALDAALRAGELHGYLGGDVDAAGWPVGPNGKRLSIGSSA